MPAKTQAVDEYLDANRGFGSLTTHSEAQNQLLRKSFAAQLARSATQGIEDRRKRAAVKAEVYAHLVPLLDRHWQVMRDLHRFYRKLLAGLGAGLALTLILLAISLTA